MLVNEWLDDSWWKGLPNKVAEFIGLFNFEWHSQNKVGNIGILILWRDCHLTVPLDATASYCAVK